MKRMGETDKLVAHYLNGGADLELTQQRLREVEMLPLFDRPYLMVPDADLYLEIALRRGPRYRCSCCGWMQPGCAIRHEAPPCDNCGPAGNVQRINGRTLSALRMEGKQREWYLETARMYGVVPETEAGHE